MEEFGLPMANAHLAMENKYDKKFPVKNKQIAAKIHGIHTEVIMSIYADHYFIVITQNNKLGSLLAASSEESSFSIRTLLGKPDEPLQTIYARQLIELISSTSTIPNPLLLAISLQPTTPQLEKSTFKVLLHIIDQNKIW